MSDASISASPSSWSRASQSWTDAISAAGFSLRYLIPMRRQLIDWLESEEEADEGLRMLIAHLVKVGFADRQGTRLRDHLLRAVRSASRACWKRRRVGPGENRMGLGEKSGPGDGASDESQWLRYWRDGLLERAWRELERREHADPSLPVFSVLHTATRLPGESSAMWAVRIAAETSLAIDERRVAETLPQARSIFADLLRDEIRGTLDSPSDEELEQEIQALGLQAAMKQLGG